MSGYIVTTHRPGKYELPIENGDRFSRHAVATLDEAKREVIVQAGYAPQRRIPLALFQSLERLPESGGRVGPLPDGTAFEIERQAAKR